MAFELFGEAVKLLQRFVAGGVDGRKQGLSERSADAVLVLRVAQGVDQRPLIFSRELQLIYVFSDIIGTHRAPLEPSSG